MYQEFQARCPASRWSAEGGSLPEPCISGQIFLCVSSFLFWGDLGIIDKKTLLIKLYIAPLTWPQPWLHCSHLLPWAPPSSLLLDGRNESTCSCLHLWRWHQWCWWWILTLSAFLRCSALKLHLETLSQEIRKSISDILVQAWENGGFCWWRFLFLPCLPAKNMMCPSGFFQSKVVLWELLMGQLKSTVWPLMAVTRCHTARETERQWKWFLMRGGSNTPLRVRKM